HNARAGKLKTPEESCREIPFAPAKHPRSPPLAARTQGRQPFPAALPPLLLVTPRQFHIHAQVAVQVGLRSVEIEVADGDAAQVAAHARVDGFTHDAVHAGERADIDDSRGALLGQVHYLADVEHHLAEGAFARQVGTRALQDFVDVGFLAAFEILLEGLQQDVLVALLHALTHLRAQRFQGPDAAGQLQIAEVLGVGVPDPLDDVGKPASAPYSSRQRTRFSFENVFRRQKISPTMPMTGWLPSARFGASLRKRSRQRTIESLSASNCTPGSVGVDSSVSHRSVSDSS